MQPHWTVHIISYYLYIIEIVNFLLFWHFVHYWGHGEDNSTNLSLSFTDLDDRKHYIYRLNMHL